MPDFSKDPERWHLVLLAVVVIGGYVVAGVALAYKYPGAALTVAAVVTWAVVQVMSNYGK